ARRRLDGAVRLHGDLEAAGVQRSGQRCVDLQERLAAGQHDKAALAALPPLRFNRGSEGVGRVLAAAGAVGADEVGVAEFANGLGAVLLAAGPQIAAGKTAEHRRAAGLCALALQRQEYLFDRVHRAVIRTLAEKLWRASPRNQSPLCS